MVKTYLNYFFSPLFCFSFPFLSNIFFKYSVKVIIGYKQGLNPNQHPAEASFDPTSVKIGTIQEKIAPFPINKIYIFHHPPPKKINSFLFNTPSPPFILFVLPSSTFIIYVLYYVFLRLSLLRLVSPSYNSVFFWDANVIAKHNLTPEHIYIHTCNI